MGVHTVAKTSQISDRDPLVVTVEGCTIGIFKLNGKYYAYENECPHEGGPVIEGLTIGHIECKITPNGRVSESQSETKRDIVCPWHGVPYDMETGVCTADDRMRLVAHDVIVEGDDVKVKV